MNITIMLTGSEKITSLNEEAKNHLTNITKLGALILVGNYKGADIVMLQFLKELNYNSVEVYKCSSKKSFGYTLLDVGKYPAQDIQMRGRAEYCLALYDGVSKGTLRNINHFGKKCRIVQYT